MILKYDELSEWTKETVQELAKKHKCSINDIEVHDAEFLYVYYLKGNPVQIYAD